MPGKVSPALLDDAQLKGRRLGRKPTPADRQEMLRLYDLMSDDGRKMIVYMARLVAREEGLLPSGTSGRAS